MKGAIVDEGDVTQKHAWGILGGTFDPIHLGHLILAQSAREQLQLARVLFVPAAAPPHKQHFTPAAHRLAMVRLAIAGNPYFDLSTIELQRQGPSYTIDTIEALAAQYHYPLVFIAGGDTLLELPSWRQIDRLLRICTFAIGMRPHYSPNDVQKLEQRFGRAICRKLRRHYFSMPLIEISSSLIRQRLAAGQSISYLVPAAVETYITQHRLYQPSSAATYRSDQSP